MGHPLEELVKKFFFDKFLDRIEEFKISFFSPITTESVLFEIPYTTARFLWDEFGAVIQNLDQSTSCFTIPTPDLMKIFARTIQPIVSFILNFIAKVSVSNSTKIVISGGFSQCFFLFSQLKEQIPNHSAVLPSNIIQDETFCMLECCAFASCCNGSNFNLSSNNFVQLPFPPRRVPPIQKPRTSTTPVLPVRN